MEEDYLTLVDPYGKLLVHITITSNRLYKTNMNTGIIFCLQVKTNKNWKWHQRLGHVNFKSLNFMVDKNIMIGMSKIRVETKACESCLVGK